MLEILIHLGNHLVKRNIELSGVLFRSKTSFNCTLWNNKIPGWQGSKPRWMASLWNVPRQVFSGPWTSQVYWEMLFKQQDLLRCEETGVYCSRGFGAVFYKSGSQPVSIVQVTRSALDSCPLPLSFLFVQRTRLSVSSACRNTGKLLSSEAAHHHVVQLAYVVKFKIIMGTCVFPITSDVTQS